MKKILILCLFLFGCDRYVNIREFDFRIQEYEIETYKCNSSTCTRDHIREIKVPPPPLTTKE